MFLNLVYSPCSLPKVTMQIVETLEVQNTMLMLQESFITGRGKTLVRHV